MAKESVAARDDERGVLLPRQFTGAAQQLHEAPITFRRRDPRVLGIRVGRHPRSGASRYLEGQAGIGRLVQELVSLLEGRAVTPLRRRVHPRPKGPPGVA